MPCQKWHQTCWHQKIIVFVGNVFDDFSFFDRKVSLILLYYCMQPSTKNDVCIVMDGRKLVFGMSEKVDEKSQRKIYTCEVIQNLRNEGQWKCADSSTVPQLIAHRLQSGSRAVWRRRSTTAPTRYAEVPTGDCAGTSPQTQSAPRPQPAQNARRKSRNERSTWENTVKISFLASCAEASKTFTIRRLHAALQISRKVPVVEQCCNYSKIGRRRTRGRRTSGLKWQERSTLT